MQGISSKAVAFGSPKNKKEFNGIDHTTELDINQYDAFYRNLDPQIGRFLQIDPKPDESFSPYSSFNNNPIFYADFLGDRPPKYTIEQLLAYGRKSTYFKQLLADAGITGQNYNQVIYYGRTKNISQTEDAGGENVRIRLDPRHSKKLLIVALSHELTNKKNITQFRYLDLDAITGKIKADDYVNGYNKLENESLFSQYKVAKELQIRHIGAWTHYGNKLLKLYNADSYSDEGIQEELQNNPYSQSQKTFYYEQYDRLRKAFDPNKEIEPPLPPDRDNQSPLDKPKFDNVIRIVPWDDTLKKNYKYQ